MNKKILVLLSFAVVVAGMSTACALDLNDLSNVLLSSPEENVTVCGINFTVPEGYSEIENESVDSEPLGVPLLDVNISTKSFMNEKGDVLILSASSSDVPANDDYAKDAAGEEGNRTTINGVDGYQYNDPDFYGFTFAKDGKLVIISASDKEVFNDVVVA